MEGGHDALGENPGAEGAGRLPRDAAIEDELHLVGPAQVEILAHDFFEEAAAGAGPIEDLGQGEFRLEDRELVAIAGAAMRGREGMREAAEPLADDRVDLRGIEGVGDPLHARRLRTGADAIVEGLVRDVTLRELALEPLMPVEADLHRVGKVGAELDEEGTEVPIEQIEVVVIDRGG